MMPQDVALSGMEGVQWAQLELTGLCSGWLTHRERAMLSSTAVSLWSRVLVSLWKGSSIEAQAQS